MNVRDLVTSYLVAIECANRAFESDQRANRREPSPRFLQAQERLEDVKEAMERLQIRTFTGRGLR